MNPLPRKNSEPLESEIQTQIIQRLTLDEWYCVRTHGNKHQCGFPDIFACCRRFGVRWIEVKRPKKFVFTEAQLTVFTKFATKNVGVWVLTDVKEVGKLFTGSNWTLFLSSRGITLKDSINRIKKHGPEGLIQDAIIDKLTKEGWFCIETYGSVYQSGLPDIFCCHKQYGTRWIECKNPAGYQFTPKQAEVFPHFGAKGVGIWILMSASETDKIFGPPNWHHYLWK